MSEEKNDKKPFRTHMKNNVEYVNFEAGQVSIPLIVIDDVAKYCNTSLDRARRFMAAYVKTKFGPGLEGFSHTIQGVALNDDIKSFCENLNKSGGIVKELTAEEKELRDLRMRVKELRKKIKGEKNVV